MKPHIKRIGGLWYCAGAGRISCNYTPFEAYRDWEAM